jgi:hypothetical protein
MRVTWATAGLALLTAVAAGGCGDDRADDAAVVPAAESLSIRGDEVEVMLPSGQFVFTVTEPRDELSGSDASDGESREAPDGQQYVGLAWDWEGMAGRAFSLLNHDVPPEVASVSVLAGGDEVEVFQLDTQDGRPAGRAWVLVPDDADLTLEVTYDGHTQSVDLASGEVDAGVAKGFYDLATYDVDCPDQGPGAGRGGLQYRIDCTVGEVVAAPYVADLGWADEGETWLLVQVELQLGEARFTAGTEQARYRVAREDGAVTVGNGDAVELWQAEGLSDGFGATYAVPVPVDGPWQLDITRSYDLTRDGTAPGAPATEHIEYASTVTLGS